VFTGWSLGIVYPGCALEAQLTKTAVGSPASCWRPFCYSSRVLVAWVATEVSAIS
jgi:hypothetical protein